MCRCMCLCVYVQKPVAHSVLGNLSYHSPPYSFEAGSLIATAAGLTAGKTQQASYSTPTVVGLQSGIQPHPGLVSNKVKDEDQHGRLSSDLLTFIDMPGICMTLPHEYVHTCAHISYTVKFFKMQEKHIRGTYICKKQSQIPY